MKKFLWLILALLCPPVVVALLEGFGFHFWLNLLLVWLFIIPSSIHAMYLVLTRDYPRTR